MRNETANGKDQRDFSTFSHELAALNEFQRKGIFPTPDDIFILSVILYSRCGELHTR